MPEFSFPGIFLEETGAAGKPIEGVPTGTAAFVGMTARGPAERGPRIGSRIEFERLYGGPDDLRIAGEKVRNYLALAVDAFFGNGGRWLHVARVVGAGAVAGTSPPLDPEAGPDRNITFAARDPGGATIAGGEANFRIRLREERQPTTRAAALELPAGTLIEADDGLHVVACDGNAAIDPRGGCCEILTLSVEVRDPEGHICRFDGLGFHPDHPRFVGYMLGGEAISPPVRLDLPGDMPAAELRAALLAGAEGGERTIEVSGGSDGDSIPALGDYQAALDALLGLEDVATVAAPGASSFEPSARQAIARMLVAHAESERAYRFALIDPPPGLEPAEVRNVRGEIESRFAAIYYPWIRIANPLAETDKAQPSEIHVPPSGAICGIYARNDAERGVHHAPANESVRGALGLQRELEAAEQGRLNRIGINCIRTFAGRGTRVWGARTASVDPEWKYVNVRRYVTYLEHSIDRGTQWVIFEPIDDLLMSRVARQISYFLLSEWTNGGLAGSKPEEAWFVRCDRTTMTQDDLDEGRLVCIVGVALLEPAEFIVLRIGQIAGC